jgi:hypothetical protein
MILNIFCHDATSEHYGSVPDTHSRHDLDVRKNHRVCFDLDAFIEADKVWIIDAMTCRINPHSVTNHDVISDLDRAACIQIATEIYRSTATDSKAPGPSEVTTIVQGSSIIDTGTEETNPSNSQLMTRQNAKNLVEEPDCNELELNSTTRPADHRYCHVG